MLSGPDAAVHLPILSTAERRSLSLHARWRMGGLPSFVLERAMRGFAWPRCDADGDHVALECDRSAITLRAGPYPNNRAGLTTCRSNFLGSVGNLRNELAAELPETVEVDLV